MGFKVQGYNHHSCLVMCCHVGLGTCRMQPLLQGGSQGSLRNLLLAAATTPTSESLDHTMVAPLIVPTQPHHLNMTSSTTTSNICPHLFHGAGSHGLPHCTSGCTTHVPSLNTTPSPQCVAVTHNSSHPVSHSCTASRREPWAAALHQWLHLTEDKVHIVWKGKDCEGLGDMKVSVIIVSYELLDRFMEHWGGRRSPQVVVLDESHFIKNTQVGVHDCTMIAVQELAVPCKAHAYAPHSRS